MPQTCGVDSRAESGAPGTAESGAESVIAISFTHTSADLHLAPRAGRGRPTKSGGRGGSPASGLAETPPHPDPLPASGARESNLPRHLLDAGDQFVDRLVHRHLLADHAVHRLGPD